MPGDVATHDYSRREVRRLANVTERQIRSWEKQGLIPAQKSYGYRDLVALHTLAKLRRNKVPVEKIRLAIAALRDKLADVKDPLVELKLFSEGRTIRVHVGGQTMEPVSGQLLLGFDRAQLQQLVSFPQGDAQREQRRDDADRLFQEAMDLEQAGATLDAIEIYRRILEIDPGFAGALVNLGTIFFSARDLDKARRYYEQAIASDPSYALAHFNLGNVHDELGDRAAALTEYQAALRLNPNYADAHYNVALLYQASGEIMRAVRHWKSYLKLDPMSPWATIARRELNKIYRDTVVDR